MLPAEDRIRIQHMLDAASKARSFVAGRSREHLDEDEQLSLSLQRLIEIVGEAAKKVSSEGRAEAPKVPWPKIGGMRNRLIHAYFDVNLDILWDTIVDDLPPLIAELEAVLAQES